MVGRGLEWGETRRTSSGPGPMGEDSDFRRAIRWPPRGPGKIPGAWAPRGGFRKLLGEGDGRAGGGVGKRVPGAGGVENGGGDPGG